jgi:hypothetical protein
MNFHAPFALAAAPLVGVLTTWKLGSQRARKPAAGLHKSKNRAPEGTRQGVVFTHPNSMLCGALPTKGSSMTDYSCADEVSAIDRDFLAKVIPDDGVYFMFRIHRTAERKGQKAIYDLASLAAELAKFCDQGFDVYHACASFNDGNSREAANARSLRALYIDLDCGEEKVRAGKGYATKGEAEEALRGFCIATGLPFPLLVDSGGGLHAYWPLKEVAPAAAWKTVAERLKALCGAHGLMADTNVTADAARILRPVGSYNRKYDPPCRVQLLEDNGPFSFDTLRALIDESHAQIGTKAGQNSRQGPSVSVLPPLFDEWGVPEHFKNLPSFPAMMEETARLAGSLIGNWDETPDNVQKVKAMLACIPPDIGRDDWRALAWSVAWLGWTVGEQIFTDWSKGYDKYWSAATDGGAGASKQIEDLFSGYDANRGTSIGTLIYHARKNGYVDRADPGSTQPGEHSSTALDWVDQMNRQYAWVEAQKTIYRFDFGDFVKTSELKTQYLNAKLQVSADGKIAPVCRVNAWLGHPLRRQHRGLVFAPGQPPVTGGNDINTWTGFAIQPKAGDVGPYIELRDHLFPNPDEQRYVEQWLAHKLLRPGVKMNTALLVWSRAHGAGKNLFFETFGNIVGEQHYCLVTKESLTGQFNSWAKNRIFVIGDEVLSGSNRPDADKFKTLISGTKLRIEEKHQPAYEIENHIGFVFLSNHEDAIHLVTEDRRFFVVEVSAGRKSDAFYHQFVKWRDTGGCAALHHYLTNQVSLSGFNPTAPAPTTAAKQQMIAAGRSSLEQWMVDALEDPVAVFGGEVVSTALLHKVYREDTGDARSSDKAVQNAAKKAGGYVHQRQLRSSGRKVRVGSLANHQEWDARDTQEWREEFERVQKHMRVPVSQWNS